MNLLCRIVRDNFRALFAAAERGFTSPLTAFVQSEPEAYVDCGVLARAFSVLACPECREQKLMVFSCEGRGFCPSSLGRRMAQTAANLV